jgi:hypothetical protein
MHLALQFEIAILFYFFQNMKKPLNQRNTY